MTSPVAAAVAIPDPSLVVLIGAAGSGKSTVARRHFAPDEILLSDAFRAAIGHGEADQSVTAAAFGRLHRALSRRLATGGLTVVDATNVRRHARRALLKRAAAAGVPAVAIVLQLPATVVIARNAGRLERVVDPEVVRLHLADVDRTAAPGRLESEGFALVVRLRSPEAVDSLRVVRLSRADA